MSMDYDSSLLASANAETVLYIQGINANVAATTFLIIPQLPNVPNLNYVVYAYIVCTTSGGGDTVPTFTIGFTDDSGANSENLTSPAAPTLGSRQSSVLTLYAPAGTSLTYTISGGSYSNGSQYSLRLIAKVV